MSSPNIFRDEEYDPLLRLIPKQKFNPEEFDIEKEARIRKRIIAEIKAEREEEQGNKNIKDLPLQAVTCSQSLKQDIEVI